MPTVFYGTKAEPGYKLEQSNDLLAVRTRSRRSLTRSTTVLPSPVSDELDDGSLVAEFPEAGVEVYRVPTSGPRAARSMEDRKLALRSSPDVRFAGGVLVDPASGEPVLYTENLFIKFVDSADPAQCREVIRNAGLILKYQVDYTTNGFFAAGQEGIGQKIFALAEGLLKRDDVEFCHPELVRKRSSKQISPRQWHLKKTTVNGSVIDAHANVEAAHMITRGQGIIIAIIDDGVDIEHPEFGSLGKIVAPRDATQQSNDPRPKTAGDNHGTACAGVACADGTAGASGVAPRARLMPIRLASTLGSQREADAFQWAADKGADVISCSWGPRDGKWWDSSDPLHAAVTPLPTSTRLAIDYAVANGRGGKGCVVLFAAGNGNESVDNDGYASYSKVIAVTACNDRGKRSVYSDFGEAAWCSFPSSDSGYAPLGHPAPLTAGIWTTDRLGFAGYNPDEDGLVSGDAELKFTDNFGGTSSACPGAAGVAALVLAVNPSLNWLQVKNLLRQACDRIDPQGGDYQASGHSKKYGYGRLNARAAVDLAQPRDTADFTVTRTFNALLPDLQTVNFTLDVGNVTPISAPRVSVDIKHTYIGDLVVSLVPPDSTGVSEILLHNRAGGATRNLRKTYDLSTTARLGELAAKSCAGTWSLKVRDAAAQDAGKLVSFGIMFSVPHSELVDRDEKAPHAALAHPAAGAA